MPRWTTITIVAALLVVAAAVGVLVVDDGEDDAAPATTTQPATTATTTTATTAPQPSTSTTTAGPAADTETAVFPSGPSPYTTPEDAAEAFAEALAFRDPVIGAFRAGDARSGEVDVRPTVTGPVTTVFVRMVGDDDRWWVLGAATGAIEIEEPAAMATIASPVELRGRSTAFEANVAVEVRQDAEPAVLGTGFVMGGANGEMGPFAGSVRFDPPSTSHGALVLATRSMEDGSTWEASVVRVRFATPAATTTVDVFFHGADAVSGVTAYPRAVPSGGGVLRAALEELLAGPSDQERASGATSWFSEDTAGLLVDVALRDGLATVDLGDLPSVIPNASTSAGSMILLEELDATVFQFRTVDAVVYRLDGDCEAFNEWLQFGGCEPRTRTG
jgi:hypothetical protein